MFKRLLGSRGVDAPTVDTVLDPVGPSTGGGPVRGKTPWRLLEATAG
nr:hypothetical protein [Streptomyces sp. NWU339]